MKGEPTSWARLFDAIKGIPIAERYDARVVEKTLAAFFEGEKTTIAAHDPFFVQDPEKQLEEGCCEYLKLLTADEIKAGR